jgi:hypothetical protein
MKSDLRSVCFHNSVKMSEYDQLNGTASQVLHDISIVFIIIRSSRGWWEVENRATCGDVTKSQK